MEDKPDLIISTLNAFQTEVRERLESLEQRMSSLENEARTFREEVNARFANVHRRIGQLENYLIAIGTELKSDFKDKVRRLQRQAEKIHADVLNARSKNFSLKADFMNN